MKSDPRLNGNGRKPFGFSLKPEIVDEFSSICQDRGLIGSRQIELLLLEFIDQNKK